MTSVVMSSVFMTRDVMTNTVAPHLLDELLLCKRFTRGREDFMADSAIKSPCWHRVLNLWPSNPVLFALQPYLPCRGWPFSWLLTVFKLSPLVWWSPLTMSAPFAGTRTPSPAPGRSTFSYSRASRDWATILPIRSTPSWLILVRASRRCRGATPPTRPTLSSSTKPPHLDAG